MALQEATADDLARACLQAELENRRLKAENARLRGALFDLLEADVNNWDTMHPDLARQRARAALAHSEDA
jgi:hypothetical protein